MPNQLARLYAAALASPSNANLHLSQVEHPSWPAALSVLAAAASTSGNTTDLAQNATSVENNGNR